MYNPQGKATAMQRGMLRERYETRRVRSTNVVSTQRRTRRLRSWVRTFYLGHPLQSGRQWCLPSDRRWYLPSDRRWYLPVWSLSA